ncbi:hypothetical protein FQZ97_934290 [compost metagenome]
MKGDDSLPERSPFDRLPDKPARFGAKPLEWGFETQFIFPAFPFVGSCPAPGEPWPTTLQKTDAAGEGNFLIHQRRSFPAESVRPAQSDSAIIATTDFVDYLTPTC